MDRQFLSRLSTRLGLAMLQSVLVTIVLILTTVALFGYARVPKSSPLEAFKAIGLDTVLSKPNTQLSFVIESGGETRSIPASDEFKKIGRAHV